MYIDKYIDENFMIWIDTCSILHHQFRNCIENMLGKLSSLDESIYITQSVYNELKNHCNSKEYELINKASEAILLVNEYINLGCMSLFGKW